MWQFLTLVALFALMAGMSLVPGREQAVNIVDATGFLLLAAFTMGELFKRIRLPALLGYIAAGLLFGPSVTSFILGPETKFHLLPENITDTEQLAYIEILTVGVIGTLGGGELKLEDLRGQVGSIAAIVALFFLAIVPTTAGIVWVIAEYIPQLAPFLQNVPSPTLLGIAVLFGVFGFAMSPAATLAIIQETRSRGPFTTLVLGVVIVADLVLVASFLVTRSFTEILVETGTLALDPVLASLPTIGAEFAWALIIGALTGLVFILYLQFVAQEMLLFTVGMIFVASYACDQFHAERLLAFLTAGFIVQNLSRHGHDMIEALERISLPVFVVYFALIAADLNLAAIPQYIWLTLILTGVRTAALFGSVKMAANFGEWALPEEDRDHLWYSFLSRGGVDLVLASLLAKQTELLGPWVIDFQAVIVSIVIVHLVIGPALLKYAFERVGETEQARSDDGKDEELIEDEPDVDERNKILEEPLEIPDYRHEGLAERLQNLRDGLTELYRERFVEPVRSHGESLAQINGEIHTTIVEALENLEAILGELDDGADSEALLDAAERIRDEHQKYRQKLSPALEIVRRTDDAPIDPSTIEESLRSVREMERFDRHVEVEWSPNMWTASPEDALPTRSLKLLRRARQSLFGPGRRVIPVGRLWRFYVELTLPRYLAGAVDTTSEKNEAFWFELDEHLREVDALYENVIQRIAAAADGETETEAEPQASDATEGEPAAEPAEVVSIPLGGSPAHVPYLAEMEVPEKLRESTPREGISDETPEASDSPVADCLRRLTEFRGEFEERAAYLERIQEAFQTKLLDRIAIAFREVYADFLAGVERAGTLQLPRFRYRPSVRFDPARQAAERVDAQLRRESEIVAGYQGWLVVDQHLTLFLHWFEDYLDRVEQVLDENIRKKCVQQLRNFESRCRERPEGWDADTGEPHVEDGDGVGEGVDWEKWLSEQVLPSLERTRRTCGQARLRISEGTATQTLLDALERRIERFPDVVPLLSEFPGDRVDDSDVYRTRQISFRDWYISEMIREAALRFVELNEHAERSLARSIAWLEDVRQVLEFNLGGGSPGRGGGGGPSNQRAINGLERAADRVREISETLVEDDDELRVWMHREMRRIVREASLPFLANQLDTIPERREPRDFELGGREEGDSGEGSLGALRRRWRDARSWTTSLYREVRDDLSRALTGTETPVTRGDVRDRLLRDEPVAFSSVPVVYRRLFTPVPIDIPDFYVPRTGLEDNCTSAVQRWLGGQATSLLVYGDRGMGKRTFFRHLRPMRYAQDAADLDEDDIVRIQFGERTTTERKLAAGLSRLVDGDAPPRTLSELSGRLRERKGRAIVVLEDAQSLFLRTPAGLDNFRRFLTFMSRTSEQILWVVLLRNSTATFLETAVNLFEYFTHSFELPPLETDQIEEMIEVRHQVSGFNLEFRKPETRLLDRLRHPIAAAEGAQRPRRAFFDRLYRLSRGNPMLALLYWLESVEVDPKDETRFFVKPLPKDEIEIARPLSLEQKLVLASLSRHGFASVGQLAEVFQTAQGTMRATLEHLGRLGFVETTPGRGKTFRMRAFAEALVNRELREENFL